MYILQITYCDFSVANKLASLEKHNCGDLVNKHETLVKLRSKVEELPGVKEYIAISPEEYT